MTLGLSQFAASPGARVLVTRWLPMTLGRMAPQMSPGLRPPPLFCCAIRPSVIGSQQGWFAWHSRADYDGLIPPTIAAIRAFSKIIKLCLLRHRMAAQET
jgi:hypothetical protein